MSEILENITNNGLKSLEKYEEKLKKLFEKYKLEKEIEIYNDFIECKDLAGGNNEQTNEFIIVKRGFLSIMNFEEQEELNKFVMIKWDKTRKQNEIYFPNEELSLFFEMKKLGIYKFIIPNENNDEEDHNPTNIRVVDINNKNEEINKNKEKINSIAKGRNKRKKDEITMNTNISNSQNPKNNQNFKFTENNCGFEINMDNNNIYLETVNSKMNNFNNFNNNNNFTKNNNKINNINMNNNMNNFNNNNINNFKINNNMNMNNNMNNFNINDNNINNFNINNNKNNNMNGNMNNNMYNFNINNNMDNNYNMQMNFSNQLQNQINLNNNIERNTSGNYLNNMELMDRLFINNNQNNNFSNNNNQLNNNINNNNDFNNNIMMNTNQQFYHNEFTNPNNFG